MFSFLGPSLTEIFTPLYHETPLQLYASSLLTVYNTDTTAGKIRKFTDSLWNRLASTPPIPTEKALKAILYDEFNQAVRIAYQKRLLRLNHWIDSIDTTAEREASLSEVQTARHQKMVEQEVLNSSRERLASFYSATFARRKKGPLTEREEINLKDYFVEAADSVLCVWQFFLKQPEKCAPIFPFLSREGFLHDPIFYRIIKNERRLYEIEAMMLMKTPVTLIAKIHGYEDFSLNEKKIFRKWVHLLNENLETPLTRKQGKIRAKDLILLFTEIINAIHIQSSYSVTFPDLIERMILEGSQIFFRDQSHAIWRASLKEGHTIEVGEKTYTLGSCLDEKEEGDTFRVFEIQEDSNLVVRIPHNPFFSYVHEKISEKFQWGIRYNGWREEKNGARTKKIAPFILEEKLHMLKDYLWTSDSWQLTKTDQELALALASHLFFMQDHNQTVENFSYPFLGRDREGVLKSTHLLRASEGNYNVWETQSQEIAGNHPFVLRFLLATSKIDQHPVALYYRGAVLHVFQTGKIDLVSRCINAVEHDQDLYKKHARKLCKQAKQMYKSCIERAEDRLTTLEITFEEGSPFISTVSDFLSLYYKNSPIASSFPPSMEEDVIHQLIHYYKTGIRPSLLSNHREYYDEMHTLMVELNQEAQQLCQLFKTN